MSVQLKIKMVSSGPHSFLMEAGAGIALVFLSWDPALPSSDAVPYARQVLVWGQGLSLVSAPEPLSSQSPSGSKARTRSLHPHIQPCRQTLSRPELLSEDSCGKGEVATARALLSAQCFRKGNPVSTPGACLLAFKRSFKIFLNN